MPDSAPFRCSVPLLLALLGLGVGAVAQELAPECEYAPDGPSQLTVGAVDCLRFESAMMGGKEPFTYYIPPACDPALGRECPVFYFLHGLSGDYQTDYALGPVGGPTPVWVQALAAGPAVDPRTTDEPWLATPDSWGPKPPLDIILVAPHGPTLAEGYGPETPKDSGWQDFHPQYWQGGESQVYDEPPPRAASMVTQELIPYVDAHFPVIAARSGRALGGISYGGVGTGHIGLRWPDLFASLQQTSGVGLAWPPACAVDPGTGLEVAVPIGPQPLAALPQPALQPLIESVIDPPLIFISQNGDGLSTDYAYTRQHHPPDLMQNARAFDADGESVIRWAFTANDAIPRQGEDPITVAVGAGLEHLVATETGPFAHAEAGLRDVPHVYEYNPGLHTNDYWYPYYRHWLEEIHAAVEHWDGGGAVVPEPVVFDYRTIFSDFEVWGWRFAVNRPITEFLNLSDVSCDGLTLRGTGVVTVTVPEACGTGVDGSNVVTVNLGPSPPLNEPAALGLCDSYGNTETVELLPEPGPLAGLAACLLALHLLPRRRQIG